MKRLCLALTLAIFCCAPALGQPLDARAKSDTAVYLKGLQTSGGGFVAEKSDVKSGATLQPTLRSTSSAVQALKYLGADLPNKDSVVKFVTRCFDKSAGGFADTPGGPIDVGATCIGLIVGPDLGFAADAYYTPAIKYLAANVKGFDEIRIAAAAVAAIKAKSPRQAEWVAETEKLQIPPPQKTLPDGRARLVASQAVTLLRLGQTLKSSDAVVKDLRQGQGQDGGYGKVDSPKSDLETTYRVMRAFMMLKAKPANPDAIRGLIQKCRNQDNGYGVAVGQPSNVSGTYYAAVISYWLEEMK
jgi:hypothetical protein